MQLGWTPRYLAARRRQRRVLTSVGGDLRGRHLVRAYSPRITRCSTRGRLRGRRTVGVDHRSREQAAKRDDGVQSSVRRRHVRSGETRRLNSGKGGIMVDEPRSAPPIYSRLETPERVHYPQRRELHVSLRCALPERDPLLASLRPPYRGGALDSLDREWPNLYDTGAGLGTLVTAFSIPACTSYRLYRVTPKTGGSD